MTEINNYMDWFKSIWMLSEGETCEQTCMDTACNVNMEQCIFLYLAQLNTCNYIKIKCKGISVDEKALWKVLIP